MALARAFALDLLAWGDLPAENVKAGAIPIGGAGLMINSVRLGRKVRAAG
jgi:hypothetical protein